MRLLYKDIAPASQINGNGSVKGGWIFEKMDYAALTIASEDFMWKLPDFTGVTNSASIKYHRSLFGHEYVEMWGDYSDISPAKVDVYVECRQRLRKSSDWHVVATATFSFSLIDMKTRKIARIPKEIVNAIKG